MKKPVILVVTKNIAVYQSFEEKLLQIFGTTIEVVGDHHPNVNMDEVDLILSSSPSLHDYIEGIKGNCKVLVANRSIEFSKLEKILDLPVNTRCLMVSSDQQTALDSVELLERTGFDHLELVAYSPEMNPLPDYEDIEVAITHGLPEIVPHTIEKTIDLGVRNIDLSTIFHISRILQISVEKAHYFTADFFRNFVRIGRRLVRSVQNEKRINQHLEAVLNAVNEGIVWVDCEGKITLCNEEATKILGMKEKSVIHLHHSEALSEFNIDEVLESRQEISNQMIRVRGLLLLVRKNPIMLEGSFLGAVITFQDVTHVQRMEQEIRRKTTESGLITKYSFEHVIGKSKAIIQTKEIAEKISRSDYTVLITGENGTGKEIFAQAIHNHSSRKDGPFVAVNFAGLTASLAESELFGYEDGAFTGARKGGKIGLFELAQNGTIFLDEIGDAPQSIQASLLRVIQERQVMRVGGNKVIPINVRIIAATNKDLDEMIQAGAFREDLFYRLNELPIQIPPLRKRREDIQILLNHFLTRKNRNMQFTAEFMEELMKYHWPGNIRELEAFINYLLVTVEGKEVDVEQIPERIKQANATGTNSHVEEVLHYLAQHGEPEEYISILEHLSTFLNKNSGIGRRSLLAIPSIPITEGQLRGRLDTLRRVGCVITGVKKQGTRITHLGTEVLARYKRSKQGASSEIN